MDANGPGAAIGRNQVIDYEPRMNTNGHEFLTTKQTKMPRRQAVSPLKDLSEHNEF